MRFAVDAHAIGRHLTGNEVYVRNLLNGFGGAGPGVRVHRLPVAPRTRRLCAGALSQRAAFRAQSLSAAGLRSGRELRRDRPDLLHVQYTAPLALSGAGGGQRARRQFSGAPGVLPLAARPAIAADRARARCDRRRAILTGSEFSRASIAAALRPGRGRGSWWCRTPRRPQFRPITGEPRPRWVRTRFGMAAPFVLTVGDLQPRKNQVGLIEAFAELCARCPQLPHHLVLAGKDTWFAAAVREAAQESGVRGPHPLHRLRDRRRSAAALQRLRPLRLSLVLRGLRAAGAGSHGLRPRGGLLEHLGAAGSGRRARRSCSIPYSRRRNRARACWICCSTPNCARAWSGLVCSGRRSSVGRDAASKTLEVYLRSGRTAAVPRATGASRAVLDDALMSLTRASPVLAAAALLRGRRSARLSRLRRREADLHRQLAERPEPGRSAMDARRGAAQGDAAGISNSRSTPPCPALPSPTASAPSANADSAPSNSRRIRRTASASRARRPRSTTERDVAPRATVGGGKTEIATGACARDALTFLYLRAPGTGGRAAARRRDGVVRRRLPGAAWSTPARRRCESATRRSKPTALLVTCKGPASDVYVRGLLRPRRRAHAAAGHRCLSPLGVFSMELVR